MKKLILILVAVVVLVAMLLSQTPAPRTVLVRNARVVPVVGPVVEGGDILIENGKIAAVGKGLTAPAGAEVLDATGLQAYPGFINAYSALGLAEIGAVGASVDQREMGRENPEVRAAWAVNPQSVHIGISRSTGTTTALTAPSGGTFPGLSALVRLDGWTLPEMAVKEVATGLINFPMTPRRSGEGAPAQAQESKTDVTTKLVDRIKDYLKEARHYLDLKAAAAKDPRTPAPAPNPKFEALAPVLDGTLPVVVSVEKSKDIELAIAFIKEFKLKAILRGCAQGGPVAAKIKAAGVPVIVDSLYAGPVDPEDGYDAAYRNVVEMSKAGITLCFSTGEDAASGKDLPYHAAKAVAFGMNRDEAIKALTINPARVFGVADRLGSLEPGKDADLFLAAGDPLDFRVPVKTMFIGGRKIDLDNWWEQMYRRWDGRPRK